MNTFQAFSLILTIFFLLLTETTNLITFTSGLVKLPTFEQLGD